ncbi:unnamed protein product [Victoria cruziana]
MVQKKSEKKVGMRAEMKLDRRTAGMSPLYQEMIARPSQSIRGGGELKKKLRRSRSWKLAERRSVGSPRERGEETDKKQTATKMEDKSPNYMKPTSSSDKRKENVQVNNQAQGGRDSNYIRKRPDARGSKSTTASASASASKNVKQLTRSSSLKPIKPSMKATGLPFFSLQDITRSTCSSTIKDSKFPDYLDLHPGGTESEGTSIFKVCPYTYCSLNGHFHKPLLPLKHFISARRRLLKTQKSLKMKGSIPRKIKNAKDVRKKIDTGQSLVPVSSNQVFRTDVISSPRWPRSWNEEQSELLIGDWSDEFFLEMFPDSVPDLTEVGSFGSCGNIESCSDEQNDANESSESLIVSREKSASESEQDCVQEEGIVTSGAHYERNIFLAAENADNHQDGNDDSCLGEAETAAALSGTSHCLDCNEALDQLSDESDCSFPEEQRMTSEACGGSESDEDGMGSETTIEMEEDDEESLCDEIRGSSFPDAGTEPPSTALVQEAVSSHAETAAAFSGNSQCLDCNEALDRVSDENDCSFPEERDMTSETCGGSESDADGMSSETVKEMEEDDEVGLCDETRGSSFPDAEAEPPSTAMLHEAVSSYAETTAALSGTSKCLDCNEALDRLSDENDCSFPEEQDMTSEACTGSESDADGMSSETVTEREEDDEVGLCDETRGSSFPDTETKPPSTALVHEPVSSYAETAAALSGTSQCLDCNEALDQLSVQNDCSFPEEQHLTSEACGGGSESGEDGMGSETITEVEEDDEVSVCDETSGSSFPDAEIEPASTALVHEAVSFYDEPESHPFSNGTRLDVCDQTSNPLPEDFNEAIVKAKLDSPAASGDEIVIMKEDQTEKAEFLELHLTKLECLASEDLQPEINFPAAPTDEMDMIKEEVHTEFIDIYPDIDIPAAECKEIDITKEEAQPEFMGFVDLQPKELEPVIYESLDVDIPASQEDEVNTTSKEVQLEATAPVVQTEATVIVDLYPTEHKEVDYEDEIPNPDNPFVKGDEASVDASCELRDREGAKEIFVDVQVASDGQVCPDVETMVEAIPDYSVDVHVADETTFSETQSSDLAVIDINMETQIKENEHLVDLQTESYPPLLLVPEAKDEIATGDNDLNLMQKDIECIQLDIASDQNHQDATDGKDFQVECRDRIPEGEACTTKSAEVQSFAERHEAGPSDSQCACNISLGESGDQKKPTAVQDCCRDVEKHMNCDTKQQEDGARKPAKAENLFALEKSSGTGIARSPSNQSEVSSFECTDDTGNMNKDDKVMRPVTNTVQPPVSNYSGLRYRANPKQKVQNIDEERTFNPRGPRFLPIEPDPDAEKVDLRHQMMDERKNSEEWMLDYALRQAVNKLAPSRKKKVALLVEAFETIMPLPKCEARVHHSAMSFTHARMIQACR